MLLVGTTKNCILQGTLSLNFSLVVQGPTEEIWALAIHPNQSQFISGGHDHYIHLWDTMSHSVVWTKDIGESVQSVCFSPDGSVVGLATRSGRLSVLNATRQIYSMHADGSEAIG
ncbi:echinoderm microtubule-associated protein-like 1 [Trichonephila clavata]|uniref:Echinoderm microtubule-associated protein-like 1 n=1 Tax=Trichonephila clavata TaxID=2740835 RepID=A0A8X6JXJ3_TRICU|nr:echinoderm microtubule-associated protein-like 1 [Trichonephila clavata]